MLFLTCGQEEKYSEIFLSGCTLYTTSESCAILKEKKTKIKKQYRHICGKKKKKKKKKQTNHAQKQDVSAFSCSYMLQHRLPVAYAYFPHDGIAFFWFFNIAQFSDRRHIFKV